MPTAPETGVLTLPAPDGAARTHSDACVSAIRREIVGSDQVISFERYMDLALYAPGLGYYAAGATKFGPDGDFLTAPDVSTLFGKCLARQIAELFEQGVPRVIFEAGAGNGALAKVLLDELAKLECTPRRYTILEPSPELSARQREQLEDHAAAEVTLEWTDDFPPAGFAGVVIANEVLDAMPVCRFWQQHVCFELGVGFEDGRLCWRPMPLTTPELDMAIDALQSRLGEPFATDYMSEVGLVSRHWLAELVSRLNDGVVLLFDYGYAAEEYYHPQRTHGTLSCFYRHRRHSDPFWLPGLQDITAHVDFSAMASAAVEAGGEVAGYTTQANFLLSCGVADMFAHLEPASADFIRLSAELKTLTLPAEMGDVVKVMAITRNLDASLLGFAERDFRDRLWKPHKS